ncbi:MAG: hypothetical protein U1E45_20415 [Geminicoccaceae bacterium]
MGLPRELIRTIDNLVVGEDLLQAAARSVDHPWFALGEPPVIMVAGLLSAQKDYPTLVKAFAAVRERRPARLVIFGSTTDPLKVEKR